MTTLSLLLPVALLVLTAWGVGGWVRTANEAQADPAAGFALSTLCGLLGLAAVLPALFVMGLPQPAALAAAYLAALGGGARHVRLGVRVCRADLAVGVGLLLLLGTPALLALVTPPLRYDAFASWWPKVLEVADGRTPQLVPTDLLHVHPEYPRGLAWLAVVAHPWGRPDPRFVKLTTVLFTWLTALLMCAWSRWCAGASDGAGSTGVRRAGLLAAVLLLCLPDVAKWAHSGYADLPLASCVLVFALGLSDPLRDTRRVALFAIAAVGAASIKQEGAVLVVLALARLAADLWRRRLRGAQALGSLLTLGVLLPWWLLRASGPAEVLGSAVDVLGSPVLLLGRVAAVARQIGTYLVAPTAGSDAAAPAQIAWGAWLALLAALILLPRGERRWPVMPALLLGASYLAVLVVTPFGIEWQVRTAFPRLIMQVLPLLLAAAVDRLVAAAPRPAVARAVTRPGAVLLAPLLLSIFVAGGCGDAGQARPPNILLIIADDLGADMVAAYGSNASAPATPRLERLAREGVLFRNVWANPTCSPTRATVLTGRYGFRTGVGAPVTASSPALSPEEVTLPELLDRRPDLGYRHACIGKWHLGNASNGGIRSPNLAGFGHYAGSISGLWKAEGLDYFHWPRVEDGQPGMETRYNTTATVDDALEWIGETAQPWFCLVAFCAPHEPLHAPPPELHTVALPAGSPDEHPLPYFQAMVQAMDTEVGRLIDGLGEARQRTVVIFLGDNGTPSKVLAAAGVSTGGKGTLDESGVRVPLIVAGPVVRAPGTTCAALVNTTDLFATIAELAGIDRVQSLPGTRLDSLSLVPVLGDPGRRGERTMLFAEAFPPGQVGTAAHEVSVRDERFQLIRREHHTELFDLAADPAERVELLTQGEPSAEARQALGSLESALDALLDSR